MSDPIRLAVLAAGAALLVAGAWTAVAALRRSRTLGRLWLDGHESAPPEGGSRSGRGRLAHWLALAGLRRSEAPRRFLVTVAATSAGGIALAAIVQGLPAYDALRAWSAALPVLGPALGPLVAGLPWLAALAAGLTPVGVVRARRQARIDAVEADLPLVLELLATLSEAGLGFDSALARILDAQDESRPLARELRALQRDAAAGLRRSESLRRLAARLEIPVVSSVVSALVQAEETGAGIAGVLRPLADELRNRRREQELARVEALPNKLVFALVVGFLPGLLLWTLGPSFHQLFEIIDSITAR